MQMVQRRSIIPIIWCISFLNTSACENMWNWPLKYFPKCFVENILPRFDMLLLIFNNVWLKFGLFWGFKEKSMLSMRMLIKAINRVDRVSEAIYKIVKLKLTKSLNKTLITMVSWKKISGPWFVHIGGSYIFWRLENLSLLGRHLMYLICIFL